MSAPIKLTSAAILALLLTALAMPAPLATAGLTKPQDVSVPMGNDVGGSVAVSGSTVLIGAPGESDFRGSADVDVNAGNGWRRQATLRGTANDESFGFSVAVQSTRTSTFAIVGAIGPGGHADGSADVYTRSGHAWRHTATLTDPQAAANEALGWSMAASTTTAVISAYNANGVTGAVVIFGRSGNTWHFVTRLTPPAPAPAGDAYGWTMAISGATIVVTALGPTTSPGAAYVYTRSGGTWHLEATLTDPDGHASDLYGTGAAIVGSFIAIGAAGVDGNRGVVYLYHRSKRRWLLSGTLHDPTARAGDWFGTAAAMSGPRLIVGASRKGRQKCGAVYFYQLSGTRWQFKSQVVNPDCVSGDDFGDKLALSGTTAVIGAPGKQQNTGAAYVAAVP